MNYMKALKKPSSINLPIWMDRAIRDLAQRHKRSVSGEIEFLIEEAIKKTMPNDYEQIAAPEKEKREAIDV
ncbi:MAG: hypothetical protein LBP37_04030 [Spirochaetaceae bacterium]|jgi:hypothetical protein|nr:hypothetical protein [Spirochaetaceae bacterium]